MLEPSPRPRLDGRARTTASRVRRRRGRRTRRASEPLGVTGDDASSLARVGRAQVLRRPPPTAGRCCSRLGPRHGSRRAARGRSRSCADRLERRSPTRSATATRSLRTAEPVHWHAQPVRLRHRLVRHAGQRRTAAGRLRRSASRSATRTPVHVEPSPGRRDPGHRLRRARRGWTTSCRRTSRSTAKRSATPRHVAHDPEIGGDHVGAARRRHRPAGRARDVHRRASCTRPAPMPTSSSWRVVDSDGPIVESDWIDALHQVVELVRRAHEGGRRGHARSTCSTSRWATTTRRRRTGSFDPTLHHLLKPARQVRHDGRLLGRKRRHCAASCTRPRSRRGTTTRCRPADARTRCPSSRSERSTPNGSRWRCSAIPATGSGVRARCSSAEHDAAVPRRPSAAGANHSLPDSIRESIDPDDYRASATRTHAPAASPSGAVRRLLRR